MTPADLAKKLGMFTTTPEEEIARLETEIKFQRELIVLKEERIAHLRGAQPSLSCSICGSTTNVRRAGKWLMGTDLNICPCCFNVWYDEGLTEMDAIKQRSLQIKAQAAEHQGQKSS